MDIDRLRSRLAEDMPRISMKKGALVELQQGSVRERPRAFSFASQNDFRTAIWVESKDVWSNDALNVEMRWMYSIGVRLEEGG
jgi:hypothetical protein